MLTMPTFSAERRNTVSLLLSASTCYRSISPARRPLSSKPTTCRCCCRSMGQTDGCPTITQTTYYAGSVNNCYYSQFLFNSFSFSNYLSLGCITKREIRDNWGSFYYRLLAFLFPQTTLKFTCNITDATFVILSHNTNFIYTSTVSDNNT